QSDRVRAAVIDRVALDEELVSRAESDGVEVRRGARVDRVDVGPHGVSVGVRGYDRPIVTRVVVLACGANYRFHKALGLGAPSVFLQSAQLETPFPAF